MQVAPIFYLPCFPSIHWLTILVEHDVVKIEAYNRFEKASEYNRYSIADANGVLHLSIPILGGRSHKQLYRETSTDLSSDWIHKHLKSWEAAYNRTPFFQFYIDDIKHILINSNGNLYQMNLAFLQHIIKILRLDIQLELTTQFETEELGSIDYREPLSVNRNIQVCKKYRQVFLEKNGFIEGLSILDLLFNMGPETTEYILSLHNK